MTTVIAWDIETCPYRVDQLSDIQRSRYDKELRRQQNKAPDMQEEEASSLVRATHPCLGWICCISAIRGDLAGHHTNSPKSWAAATPTEEGRLLKRFWADVERFPKGIYWTTFNGKRFDVPFLSARTARHRLRPTRYDLLNTYPYSHQPHADLMWFWSSTYSFADLCDLLGVASPKQGFDGRDVPAAVAAGQLEDVVEYCERDVCALLDCVRAVPYMLD